MKNKIKNYGSFDLIKLIWYIIRQLKKENYNKYILYELYSNFIFQPFYYVFEVFVGNVLFIK